MEERIVAHYLVETPFSVEGAAKILAGEQSTGTFISVPGESADLIQQFGARVENIEHLGSSDNPCIPESNPSGRTYKQARISVSWSIENFGYNIPLMMSTLQGNLYELKQFTGLKLDDFELPESYAAYFKGPSFGALGTKKLCGVADTKPIIGTIIKPSVGLTPETTAQMVDDLIHAGIDFIKDDELMGSTTNSPFAKRVTTIMNIINTFADKTGKKPMYAFNITGDFETMQKNYETVLKAGGSCAMISINSVGWAGVKSIAAIGELSIHGHRNGWGMINRHPMLGINFPAYAKYWRLAGVDQLHVNGIQNKFWESDASVVRSIHACSSPFLNHQRLLAVVSSGQWGGQAFETYKQTKTTNLLYMAGGGILAHPFGAAAGVRSIRAAWDAAVSGKTFEQTRASNKEFAASVEKFGSKS